MEGACATIVPIGTNRVMKVLKRGYRGLSAETQAHIQQLAAAVIHDHKLETLVVPIVFSFDKRSYEMERIDDSLPLYEVSNPKGELIADLRSFLRILEQKGWVLDDIECYVQPDGRIAIIDFDKCIQSDGKVKRRANAYLKNLPCV